MIDRKRLDEMLWLLEGMLPIDDNLELHGLPVKDWLPAIRKDIAVAIKKDEDRAEAILVWLSGAIMYVIGEADELPAMAMETDGKLVG